jgi:hypothetical protein
MIAPRVAAARQSTPKGQGRKVRNSPDPQPCGALGPLSGSGSPAGLATWTNNTENMQHRHCAYIFGDINWDITMYIVAKTDRQDFNIVPMMKNAVMDKGQSVTVTAPPQLRVWGTARMSGLQEAHIFCWWESWSVIMLVTLDLTAPAMKELWSEASGIV